jgi:peptidyl-prolyl cis-trans isomerase A (cyclophilin A)
MGSASRHGIPRTARRALVFCASFLAASLCLFFIQGFHRSPRGEASARAAEAVAKVAASAPHLRSVSIAALQASAAFPLPSGARSPLPVVRVTLNNLDGTAGARGHVDIEVHAGWAPIGAARFMELVEADFFAGVRFFRVIPRFMAQFGIHGDPAVSAGWKGMTLRDDPVVESNARGYLSFATSGKNTRTTQLFINYVDNKRLDSMGFSPFAKVVRGMDVVDRIYEIGEKPDQARIQSDGNAYLEKNFPQLTYIESLRVLAANAGVGADSDAEANAVVANNAAAANNNNLPAVLLSSGCKATADARGNLSPASVVTSGKTDDWLKDRHQFASDMNGTPIPGKHWIQIDLLAEALMPADLTSVRVDWETAFAEAYSFECAPSPNGPYTRREEESRTRVSPVPKGHVIDEVHFKATDGEAGCRYVRLFIEKPATRWGASVYELKIYGKGKPQCG